MKHKWNIKTGAPGFAVVDSDNEDGGNTFVVRGYASRFNQVDAGNDRTRKGAFRSVKPPLPFLYAHEHKLAPPLGVVDWCSEDREGWLFQAKIPADTMRGYEIKRLVELRALSGISYGYDVIKSEDAYVGSKRVRDLTLLSVGEISLVPWPMLDSARVLSWGAKLHDVLRDRVVIAKYEQAKAQGVETHPAHLLDAVKAMQRETERAEYGGLTWDAWSANMLGEVTRAVRELEGIA